MEEGGRAQTEGTPPSHVPVAIVSALQYITQEMRGDLRAGNLITTATHCCCIVCVRRGGGREVRNRELLVVFAGCRGGGRWGRIEREPA